MKPKSLYDNVIIKYGEHKKEDQEDPTAAVEVDYKNDPKWIKKATELTDHLIKKYDHWSIIFERKLEVLWYENIIGTIYILVEYAPTNLRSVDKDYDKYCT